MHKFMNESVDLCTTNLKCAHYQYNSVELEAKESLGLQLVGLSETYIPTSRESLLVYFLKFTNL